MVKDLCFEIIESCPNNCIFCSSNSHIDKEQIINFNDFKKVIDYFDQQGGIEELSLSGGEPFLHPDLFRFVKYAKEKNIKVVIFTSGVAKKEKLSPEEELSLTNEMKKNMEEIITYEPWNERLINNIRKYYMQYIDPKGYTNISKEKFETLKKLGIDKIVFDYQAYEAETDRMLMGRDENSRQALLTSMMYASLANIECAVHFIPMKPNYKEIGDILELLEIAKIKNISILNFVPQGRGRKNSNNLQLTENELHNFFSILYNHEKNYSGSIRIGIPFQKENTHKCNAGIEKLDIKFDGTILPCPAFKELTEKECKEYNIKLYNIYDNLESVEIKGTGTRVKPLCQKIYKK